MAKEPELRMILNRINALEEKEESRVKHDMAMLEWRHTIDKSIEASKEVIDIVRDLKGALKSLGWIGKFLKWISSACGAVAVSYAIFKGFVHK